MVALGQLDPLSETQSPHTEDGANIFHRDGMRTGTERPAQRQGTVTVQQGPPGLQFFLAFQTRGAPRESSAPGCCESLPLQVPGKVLGAQDLSFAWNPGTEGWGCGHCPLSGSVAAVSGLCPDPAGEGAAPQDGLAGRGQGEE